MGAARGVRCALAGSAPAAGDAGPASPAEAVTRPATSGIGGWRAPLLLLAVYIGLAVLLLARGLFGGRGSFPGSGTDPAIFMWDLEWVPFALGHHLDPLVTTFIHYPSGANLMWNTSIIFPALLLAPVTVLLGPITSYDVLTVLAVGLSAWCGALAVRRYTARWLPAAVGGLLYGFSPYMISQALHHPHLDIAVYPPLVLILGDEILVRRGRSPALLGVLLGAATAAQLLTGEEVLTLTGLMSGIVLAALLVIHRADLGPYLRRAREAALPAAASFILLAGFPLYVQFFGPQRVTDLGTVLDIYAARPQELIQPSTLQLIAPFGHIGFLDSSVYIGVPLAVLSLATIIWLRRRAVARLAAVILVSAVVLSLGGHLQMGGAQLPLPWAVVDHLPFLEDALPIRVMLIGYLALAMLVALFLDTALQQSRVRWRLGAALVTVAALIPLVPSLPFPASRFATPAFFTDGSAGRLSSPGSVLMTPYLGVEPLVWQAVSGMSFRTPLGLVFTPGPGGPHWSAPDDPLGTELEALGDGARPVLSAALRQACLGDLDADRVSSIVVGPSPGEAQLIRFITALVGRPGLSVGGVVVWYGVT